MVDIGLPRSSWLVLAALFRAETATLGKSVTERDGFGCSSASICCKTAEILTDLEALYCCLMRDPV